MLDVKMSQIQSSGPTVQQRAAAEAPKLSVLEWLQGSVVALKRAGVDPEERMNRTGHHRPLGTWAGSVGYWCVGTKKDVIGPSGPLSVVSAKTYEIFRYRNNLRTGRSFAVKHGAGAWKLAELIHSTVVVELKRRKGYGAVGGFAAPLAWKTGILPVEVVLWDLVFQDAMLHLGTTAQDFKRWSDEEKGKIWSLGCDGEPWGLSRRLNATCPDP